MSRLSWVLDVLAGIGAVVSAGVGVLLMRGVVSLAVALAPHNTGSGGIGAVSAGLAEGLVEGVLLVLIPGIVLNRLLAGWARRTGGIALKLHRAHLVAVILWPLAIAVDVVIAMRGPDIRWIALLTGLLIAAQFLALAALLAAFVWQRRFATVRGV